jgi:hypothetical protein
LGAAGLDAHERRLVVQGRELGQLVDLGDDVVVDDDGAIEVLAALHHAVPDGVDVVEGVDGLVRTGGERLEHDGHGGVVVFHGLVDDELVVIDAVLVEGLGGADPLADALGKHLLGLDIDELVLQRRGTSVDNEDVHRTYLLINGYPLIVGAPRKRLATGYAGGRSPIGRARLLRAARTAPRRASYRGPRRRERRPAPP